jgi:Methyltransferase domain
MGLWNFHTAMHGGDSLMHNFVKPFVLPLMKQRGWHRICEIGCRSGESSDLLKAVPGLQLTVIDPCLECDLQRKFGGNEYIDMRKGLSLDVLPELSEPFDCILIDGDHNWYTVYNELRVIREGKLLGRGGVIFFHDVEWPWARRDMYYQPDTIPAKYMHQWEQLGIVRGKSELSKEAGHFAEYKKATFEGGERNGVLTAIEDFLTAHKGEYRFFHVAGESGLGIMQYRGNMRDDLSFLALAGKGLICNAAVPVLRFARKVRSGAISGKDSFSRRAV